MAVSGQLVKNLFTTLLNPLLFFLVWTSKNVDIFSMFIHNSFLYIVYFFPKKLVLLTDKGVLRKKFI